MANSKSVFISYSSRDGNVVNEVTRMLQQAGISYWKAPEMIPPGSNYAKEIPRAIRECTVFLLIISENSQSSIWVEKELDSAINNRKTVVTLWIDDTPMNDMFKFYLNNVQAIPCQTNRQEAYVRLRRRLERLVYSETSAAERSNTGSVMIKGVADVSEKQDTEEKERYNPYRRSDVFILNKKPYRCRFCGSSIERVAQGTYRCTVCGKNTYDYYQTIRNYLAQAGAATAVAIARDTGIPRSTIEHFLRGD